MKKRYEKVSRSPGRLYTLLKKPSLVLILQDQVINAGSLRRMAWVLTDNHFTWASQSDHCKCLIREIENRQRGGNKARLCRTSLIFMRFAELAHFLLY